MSFLSSVKAFLTNEAEAQKAQAEVKPDAKARTKKFVGEFSDVAKTHKDELLSAAQQLHGIEVVKDKFVDAAENAAQTRKEEERLVCAVEAIGNQIQVVAEEILDLEEAIVTDKEAAKVAEAAAKEALSTLARCDNRKFLEIARAKRAEKAAKPEAPKMTKGVQGL